MSAAQYAAQANAERNQAEVGAIGAEMERMQFQHEQRQAQLDAKKDEAARLEDLRILEARNDAALGSSGLSGGASFDAIEARNRNTAMGNIKDVRLLGASRSFKFGVGSAAKGIEIAAYNQRKSGAVGRAILGFGTSMASLAAQGGFDRKKA